MSETGTVLVDAWMDFLPNHLLHGGDGARQMAAELLRKRAEQGIPSALERWAQLAPVLVAVGPHVALLAEARALYVNGYFYSCVAQCGITCERVLKDLAGRSLLLAKGGNAAALLAAAKEHLDWFEHSRLAKFLAACELITVDVRKAALDLGELRNRYAHGSGTDPEADALKALGYLRTVVEGTVSLFNHLPTAV